MSLPILISILSTIFFGVIAILATLREEKVKKRLQEQEAQLQRRFYEISILKQMHDRVGYSLDAEKIMDVIINSLDNLYIYSTVSSVIIKNDKLIFTTKVKEPVSRVYVEQVKKSMFNSLSELTHDQLPHMIDDHITGVMLDHTNISSPVSFFHIPFIIKNKVVGLITLSSLEPNLYKEKEMGLLYQISGVASYTVSRLEDVLALEKGKFTSLLDITTDGLFMVDTDNQLKIINSAAKKYLNIEKKTPTILDVLTALPNTYDFGGKIQAVIDENKPIEEKEVVIGNRLFALGITPVHDAAYPAKQIIIGASVLFHDITSEKSVMQMKEDFTKIISHELKSPLTAIKASSDLLVSQKEMSEEEKKRLSELISSQSKKLLDKIALILDSAKLEAGILAIRKKPNDLKKLIEEKVAEFLPQAQEKIINLTVDIDPALTPFSYDSHYINEVFTHLLSNSIKFTSSGGSIHIEAKQLPDKVTVSVMDTGIGIARDKQASLFSKFSQVSSPSATSGTGLGLYLTKGVIEDHGGSISLKSEEAEGTTITFTLPSDSANLALPTSPEKTDHASQSLPN